MESPVFDQAIWHKRKPAPIAKDADGRPIETVDQIRRRKQAKREMGYKQDIETLDAFNSRAS
jgi:hypothetical protein